jgi:predicted DNA-binding transcriptional regulator AlpA
MINPSLHNKTMPDVIVEVPRRLIRIAALCQLLGGISPRTIRDWVQAERFPRPIRLARRVSLWDVSQVEKWIRERG